MALHSRSAVVLLGLVKFILFSTREVTGEGMLNSCICELNGDVYNLTSLGNSGKNPKPRYVLSFQSTWQDYQYLFNPCYPFSWPPIGKKPNYDMLKVDFTSKDKIQSQNQVRGAAPPLCLDASLCQRDMYGPYQSIFKIVTSQDINNGRLRCVRNKTINKIQWIYKGYGSLFEKGGLVLTLICNEEKDKPDVQAEYDVDRRKGNPWKYISVEHKCCCANKCGNVTKPPTPQPHISKDNLTLEILGFGGGFLFIVLLFSLFCYLQRHLYKNQPPVPKDPGNRDYGTFTINPEYLTKIIPYKEIDLNLDNKLGEGGFGVVYKGRWKNSDVAVKRIKEHVVEADIEPFIRESLWMSKLPHHNIVQFYGICVLKPNLCIITEFMEGGSVADVIHGKQRKILSWKQRIKWAEDAAKGMIYLHSHNPPIIHRDLKSDNLLVDENNLVKIADFGATKLLQPLITRHEKNNSASRGNSPENVNADTSWVGTLRWSAPEVIPNKSKAIVVQYTTSSDVYSFAMTVWELISNQRPYYHLEWAYEIMNAIQNGERPDFPDSCPQNVKDFIEQCWHGNPKERPSFEDILNSLDDMKEKLNCNQKSHVTWPPLGSYQHKQAMIHAK